MLQLRRLTVLCALFLFASCSMPEGPVPLSGDAPEAEGWTTETLLTGLEQPWAVAWLPGGELLITERPGRLLRISPDFQQSEPVAGLPQIYADGQGGLMDLSLHPNFEENRMVYLIYASGDEDANRTTIGRGELNGNELTGFEEIFRVSPDKDGDQHFGSRMVWLDDSSFAVAIGDGGNRPQQTRGVLSREHAQMFDSHLGKILRLNEDGSTTDGNPFADQEGAYPEIWTLGHRNIQGLALDADSGRLWANEHGSRGGDELNLIHEG
jgi:aldose sugar dehydrogenase